MKKLSVLVLCAVLLSAVPAFAVELTSDATQVPSAYAVIKGGKVVYDWKSTAFSPSTFNAVLEAYGLQFSPDSPGVPANYAKMKNGQPAFGGSSMAFSPAQYNAIFNSYGLTLGDKNLDYLKGIGFVSEKRGKYVFGGKSVAYSGDAWAKILAAYNVPVQEVAQVKEVKVEEKPVVVDTDKDGVPDASDICPGTPSGAKIDERGCWVLNQDYLFDFDKAVVKPAYYKDLDEVATVIMHNKNLKVQIEGHTDSIGTESYNQGLSERRAKAVREYLVNQAGINPADLSIVGYGETRPIASNATKEGRAKNRRVELTPIW
jgi:OOP family OmpA-OmpF porin